jgi:hypothetical protein
MKKNTLFLMLLLAVAVVGLGGYALTKRQPSGQLAAIACALGQFCGGSVAPASVPAGGTYTFSCNYGYSGNGIVAVAGSGSCTYKGFSGTTATFICTAGTVPGTFANNCSLDSASPYGTKMNAVNALAVQCAPGQFCGGSVAPTSVAPGGAYTMGCNYGYSGNGIVPLPGSGTCKYEGFSATDTAEFGCTAGATPGTFTDSCSLNSASPYAKKTNSVTALTVAPLVPANAISSGDLDGSDLWIGVHDTGTPGTSVGTSTYPLTVGGYGDVRKFDVSSYSDYGAERYSIDFANETSTTHFIYDLYVQSPNPSAIGNLELDMNQVTANGDTVIFAFQCDSAAGVWDYSTVKSGKIGWVHSAVPCNVSKWTSNTWYHIQISTQRDNSGDVTYNWVAVNGVPATIGITTFEQEALGWGIGDVLANFQLDPVGASGAPMIAYVHDMAIYRW